MLIVCFLFHLLFVCFGFLVDRERGGSVEADLNNRFVFFCFCFVKFKQCVYKMLVNQISFNQTLIELRIGLLASDKFCLHYLYLV